MKWLRALLGRLFRRRGVDWGGLDYGTSAAQEDEMNRLNGGM